MPRIVLYKLLKAGRGSETRFFQFWRNRLCLGDVIWTRTLYKTFKAKKEEFAQFCMMAKTGIGKDFKAEIKTGSYSQRSFPNQRSNLFLGRLLEETTSRTATGPQSGCINQEWQFDFVCPVFLNNFRQAYSKCSMFYPEFFLVLFWNNVWK